MASRIKKGEASVECKEGKVFITGTIVDEEGAPATPSMNITVSDAEPATIANGDIWIDT